MSYNVSVGLDNDDPYCRSRLTITDGNGERSYLDGGEPEDNCFTRQYNWVEEELRAAYRQGKRDAMRRLHEFLESV